MRTAEDNSKNANSRKGEEPGLWLGYDGLLDEIRDLRIREACVAGVVQRIHVIIAGSGTVAETRYTDHLSPDKGRATGISPVDQPKIGRRTATRNAIFIMSA